MIYLTEVDPFSHKDAEELYALLEERTVQQSISHKTLPTFKEHFKFVSSEPYRAWYLIGLNGETVGATYISYANELGIFIFNKHHGMGYGREALQEMIRRYGDRDLLANINPENTTSKRFFIDLGFEKLQETYVLRSLKV